MSEGVKDRLKTLLSVLGMNARELAEKADIPYRTIQSYLWGESNPKVENLNKLKKITGVNLDWLLTGKGEMFSHEDETGTKMPLPFLKRLEKDLRDAPFGKLQNLSFFSDLKAVLDGKKKIGRKQVIEVAKVLEQPIDEYLTLSQTAPTILQQTLRNKKLAALLRSADDLDSDELDKVVEAMENVIKKYLTKKNRKP